MDETIASVLAAAFPDRAVDTVTAPDSEWSEVSRTVHVTFAGGEEAYLTIADSTSISRECGALTYVDSNCEITVPEVLAADPTATPAYLVTTSLEGSTVADVWESIDRGEQSQLIESVGRTLAAVHTCRFDDHGWISDGNERELTVETAPWPEVLVGIIERLRDTASTDRFEWYFDEVVERVEANRARLRSASSALLHGDPAQPNCVWTDDGIGFVDWEACLAGDPAWELYRARSQLAGMPMGDGPEWLMESLHEGYRERVGSLPDGYDEFSRLYAAVQFVLTAGHAEKTAGFLEDPDEEFLEWVANEAERRLASI